MLEISIKFLNLRLKMDGKEMDVMIGNDIIEVKRIEECINKLGEKFLDRVYTEKEIEYCESKKNMKCQHYAARFAGKEAIFKAISPLICDKFSVNWKDIEILNNEQGRPYAKFISSNLDSLTIDISLSHIKEYAIATAIAKM